MKKILFFLGLGVSYGECYVALKAAKHLQENYSVQFCLLSSDKNLIEQIKAENFGVSYFDIPPLHQNYFAHFVEEPLNFYSKIKEKLDSHDLVFLIDFQHFFTKAAVLPAYQNLLKETQEAIHNCICTLITFDHSLWTLYPHPYPKLASRVEPVPENIQKILLPSPPHFHNYSGMGPKHQRVSFFEKRTEKIKERKLPYKILISFSHFAPALADKISVISVEELTNTCLETLSLLKDPCETYITGLSDHSPQLNTALFEDYDQSLKEMDLVILFNGISSTITRCYFQQTPVLLCYSKDFDIYPVPFPPLELIYKDNPFFNHVHRVDVRNKQKLYNEVKNLLESFDVKKLSLTEEVNSPLLIEIIKNMF